jgi:hypothetical protein
MRFSLRSGLEVPVADRHEMATFKEIFVKQEYDDFLDLLPVPATVLDLGCNLGVFALEAARLGAAHATVSSGSGEARAAQRSPMAGRRRGHLRVLPDPCD